MTKWSQRKQQTKNLKAKIIHIEVREKEQEERKSKME